MPLNKKAESLKTFATVISDGSIRVRVNETTPEAVKREYETPKGEKGEKWELVYQSLSGLINSLEIKDTEYGQMINLEVDGIVLSLNTESSYAQDLMKKLPNVEMEYPVELTPYSFTGDNGRNMRGITVMQNGLKIMTYFWDSEKNQPINGLPTVSKDESKGYTKDDWKVFFIGVKKFLVQHTLENVVPRILPKEQQFIKGLEEANVANPPERDEPSEEPPAPTEELEFTVDNIPFD